MTALEIALVMGANRGLGFETAWQLSRAGFTVILGTRTLEKGKQAVESPRNESFDAHVFEFDVAFKVPIKSAATKLANDFDHLDVLINNVAIHYDERQQSITADFKIVEQAWETNLPHNAHYVASKWGIVGLVKAAALEAGPHSVTVNVVECVDG